MIIHREVGQSITQTTLYGLAQLIYKGYEVNLPFGEVNELGK